MNAAEEPVDVIDAAGNTIAVVTRGEMRRKRLPHRCTYVLVFNARGDLFIHQRTATKDVYPSHWDVCIGGVLAAGENFAQGARREVREELGVDADVTALFPICYADAVTFAHGMAYRLDHDGPFVLQAEEILYGEFVPLAAIPDRLARAPFCPDGVQVLEKYLREKNPCAK
ncbi:MAG: NUDIX domain-containing protein [Planctomycetes bacterium]|nr:NUDIX domain-containing protein [Planctomycetota bacterium]